MLTEEYDPLKGKMLQVLDKEGRIVAPSLEPKLEPEFLMEAYRTMVLARVVDEKAVILQRQGRLGAYPPNRGQEAASLGPDGHRKGRLVRMGVPRADRSAVERSPCNQLLPVLDGQ
jgi:hypothetical protein